ncbi:MAG: F0F1 ATP synthase subunit gamma [Thermodesulfobacteriota bacterium]
MLSLAALKKRIRTAGDLLAVVKTMKALAAVNIRQFEAAVESLEGCAAVADQGLHAFFRAHGPLPPVRTGPAGLVLVLGSDQGMCGGFNEAAAQAAAAQVAALAAGGARVRVWTCGERVRAALEAAGLASDLHLAMPGGLHGIPPLAAELILRYEADLGTRGAETLVLAHNRLARTGAYEPAVRRLLPLDRDWQAPYLAPWPRRCLPETGLPAGELFPELFRHYLAISLYRAFGLSLAAENAARLAAMQAAEKNIEERSEELARSFREARQTLVTAELLDVIAGFEALSGPEA